MLKVPVRGFLQFRMVREAYEEDVELTLHIDEEDQTYYLTDVEAKDWLMQLVPDNMVDKTLDILWNFREIVYDLAENRVVVVDRNRPIKYIY